MALFGNNEEKNEQKAQELLKKYNLENLPPDYAAALKSISLELSGTGLMDLGTALNFGTKTEDRLKISYLNALVQQNWIIIRLLTDLRTK